MSNRKKAGGYHGVGNVRRALKLPGGGYDTEIQPLLYAKGLSLERQINNIAQYADNEKLFEIASDKGYTGTFGTTAPDPDMELAAGHLKEGAAGLIDAQTVSFIRQAVYYEFIQTYKSDTGTYEEAVKVWMLGVEFGRGSQNHATDAESVEFGTFEYPFTVYGEQMQNADGTPYRNERGMAQKCFRILCYPEDPGYETFENSVPEPKVSGEEPLSPYPGYYGADAGTTAMTQEAQIKALPGVLNSPKNGAMFTISCPVGSQRVVFGYPAALNDPETVFYVELSADQKSAYEKTTIQVSDKNGENPVDYKVFQYIGAVPAEGAMTFNVKI